MSKLTLGQRVTLNFTPELAAANAIHILDEKQPLLAEVIYIHEDGNVNVVLFDHVGTLVPLLNVQTSKPKEEDVFYVSAHK